MGDFYQNGIVTTLHDLRLVPYATLEKKLEQFATRRPMCLILPSLYSELERPALAEIVRQLRQVKYLSEIVIGLDSANRNQFQKARQFFSCLDQYHRIIWHNGPGMRALEKKLKKMGLAPQHPGKGRNVWYCFGYVIARGNCDAVALHDCDIKTYHRSMLARLIYPVVEPNFAFRFCKGFYFRASEQRIHGRVARLLVTPFIRTLKIVCPPSEFLEFLDSFRYPLAGEFSLRADVIKNIRIPGDWGFELGILSEAHRNNALGRICQVEIADRYDHKHQTVDYRSRDSGLAKMCRDICRIIFSKLAANGVEFNVEMIRSIKATYYRMALDYIERFSADAILNGLSYDFNEEEKLVDLFADCLYSAGLDFLRNPRQTNMLSSWRRVISAYPDVLNEILSVVESDNGKS